MGAKKSRTSLGTYWFMLVAILPMVLALGVQFCIISNLEGEPRAATGIGGEKQVAAKDDASPGCDIPVVENDCGPPGTIIEEHLTLSDWEREVRYKSCIGDDWVYKVKNIECPNCGFLLPPFDQINGVHEVTCQRCGLKMEAWGNGLSVKGIKWDGERYVSGPRVE